MRSPRDVADREERRFERDMVMPSVTQRRGKVVTPGYSHALPCLPPPSILPAFVGGGREGEGREESRVRGTRRLR